MVLHGFRLLIDACGPARAGCARPRGKKPARALESLIENPSGVAFAGINATLTRVPKSSLETVENHAYIWNYKLIVCRPNKKLAHNRKRNARRRRGNVSEKIQWAVNQMPKSDDKHLGIMSLENVKKARAFHKSFPQYTVTPLARLDGRASARSPRTSSASRPRAAPSRPRPSASRIISRPLRKTRSPSASAPPVRAKRTSPSPRRSRRSASAR